ncbi:MAG: molybdopterin-dependent oxidoreductase [Coriobacteriia bacterium]|nr:molybdopterin-dependent oxidoreductase [Coriobacteriia bacterium]
MMKTNNNDLHTIYDKETHVDSQVFSDTSSTTDNETRDLSRRKFVVGAAALGTAVGLSSTVGSWGFNIFHPEEAFADSNAPIEVKYSYCDMCNHVPKCGLKCHVQEGKIVRVESRENYPNSPLCAKGIASLQELYDPNRLLVPKIRTNAKGEKSVWKDISWDEAYSTIASKLNSVKSRFGADAVMFYCGDPKEPRGAMQRVATLFGSSSNGTESSLCSTASVITSTLVYGQSIMGADPGEASKSCLIWSLNPAWSQPNRFSALLNAKERGVKFVVVDPRVTPTVSSLADVHLQLRPGSDGALAAGVINQLIEQNLYDKEFVDNWTYGFEELKAYVAEYTPEKVEEITWVPAEKLIEAAKILGMNTPSAFITSAKGACHQKNVGNFQRAVYSIPALLGSLDVAGGIMFSPGLGFDGFASTPSFQLEPKYVSDGFQSRRHDLKDFPVWARLTKLMQTVRFPEYVSEGKIRAAVLLGTNAMMWPNTPITQKAIKDMEFTVAIDYYERSWTHDYVDMLLPAAMCYERMAPFAIFGNKIYLRQPVIKPMGQAREDWQIILEIGSALGYKEQCFSGNVEKALDEVIKSTGLGITLDDLKAAPEGYVVQQAAPSQRKYIDGKIRRDGLPGFNTPTRKIEFVSTILEEEGFNGLPIFEEPTYNPSSPEAKQYPLILNTGSRLPFFTHSKLRDLPWLKQFMPEPVVRMNPIDAESRGIKDGDDVRMFNFQGEIRVKAEVTNMVMPGVTDIMHGWHQADVNLLTTRDFDPITGFPPLSTGLCEIAKV